MCLFLLSLSACFFICSQALKFERKTRRSSWADPLESSASASDDKGTWKTIGLCAHASQGTLLNTKHEWEDEKLGVLAGENIWNQAGFKVSIGAELSGRNLHMLRWRMRWETIKKLDLHFLKEITVLASQQTVMLIFKVKWLKKAVKPKTETRKDRN